MNYLQYPYECVRIYRYSTGISKYFQLLRNVVENLENTTSWEDGFVPVWVSEKICGSGVYMRLPLDGAFNITEC